MYDINLIIYVSLYLYSFQTIIVRLLRNGVLSILVIGSDAQRIAQLPAKSLLVRKIATPLHILFVSCRYLGKVKFPEETVSCHT